MIAARLRAWAAATVSLFNILWYFTSNLCYLDLRFEWGSNPYGETIAPDGLGSAVALSAGVDFSLALINDSETAYERGSSRDVVRGRAPAMGGQFTPEGKRK